MGYPKKEGPRAFRALLIAALFHDFGHSGKMGNDAREVSRACKAIASRILDPDKDLLPGIETLIKATEFPHKPGRLSPGGKILRDADMGQAFSNVWLQNTIFGLAQETVARPADIMKSQIVFLHGLRFYTSWGRKKFGGKIPSRVKEVEGYLDALS